MTLEEQEVLVAHRLEVLEGADAVKRIDELLEEHEGRLRRALAAAQAVRLVWVNPEKVR